MYKIVGNDGKVYGPVNADQLREWITQGRAENRTPVLPEGAAEWSIVGLLPEFARAGSRPPPVMAPPAIAPLPAAGSTNGFATAGFICGLISLTCCCGCPFNLLGLTFSIVALVQINGQTQKQAGWGLALAGLICSAVSLLVSVGLGIFQCALTPGNFTWHCGSI
jgi:hypothetical protein